MKNALVIALSLFSASSFAASPVMVKLNLQNMNLFHSATVTQDGVLTVTNDLTKTVVSEKTLNAQTLNLISNLAWQLASAPVKRTHADVVCMMLVAGSGTTLEVSKLDANEGVYTGKLRLILSQEGCWVADHTAPKDAFAAERARMLASSLEAIVYENADIVSTF